MDKYPVSSSLLKINQQLSPFGQQMFQNLLQFVTNGNRNNQYTQEKPNNPKYRQFKTISINMQSSITKATIAPEESSLEMIDDNINSIEVSPFDIDTNTMHIDEEINETQRNKDINDTERIDHGYEVIHKQNKRLKQAKITDMVNKKVKTDNIEKNVYRKEKYTKTIKTWLNDVCANKYIAQNTLDENSGSNAVDRKEITPKEKQNNRKKAKLQTQLANKDGIMKFKKINK